MSSLVLAHGDPVSPISWSPAYCLFLGRWRPLANDRKVNSPMPTASGAVGHGRPMVFTHSLAARVYSGLIEIRNRWHEWQRTKK